MYLYYILAQQLSRKNFMELVRLLFMGYMPKIRKDIFCI